MGIELPEQKLTCDRCATYTGNPEHDFAFCAVPGSCPGLEKDPVRREEVYQESIQRKFRNSIGVQKYAPGGYCGRLVDTVLNGKRYTGRYLYGEERYDLYFLEPDGTRHDNIRFVDITYMKGIKT